MIKSGPKLGSLSAMLRSRRIPLDGPRLCRYQIGGNLYPKPKMEVSGLARHLSGTARLTYRDSPVPQASLFQG